MTVDTTVPDRDTAVQMSVLLISEEGGMRADAFGLAPSMNVAYFQRLSGDISYIIPEDSGIAHVSSWRPFVQAADMIIVDDPSYVSRLSKDFDLSSKIVLYRVNEQSHKEAARLMHWLNPLTIDSLRNAIESVDVQPSTIPPALVEANPNKLSWYLRPWRLFRRSRA